LPQHLAEAVAAELPVPELATLRLRPTRKPITEFAEHQKLLHVKRLLPWITRLRNNKTSPPTAPITLGTVVAKPSKLVFCLFEIHARFAGIQKTEETRERTHPKEFVFSTKRWGW
jgi:hypothetical protein